jgi:hypothetical protein
MFLVCQKQKQLSAAQKGGAGKDRSILTCSRDQKCFFFLSADTRRTQNNGGNGRSIQKTKRRHTRDPHQ